MSIDGFDYRDAIGKARNFVDIVAIFERLMWPLNLTPKRTGIEFIDAERLWKLARSRVERVTTLRESDGEPYYREVVKQFRIILDISTATPKKERNR